MNALLHRSRRLLVILAVALGVSVALATATPASAANADRSERGRANYGALAIDGYGAWGGSYDYRTKQNAKRAAVKSCKRHSNAPRTCGTVVWVRNGCAAVSVRKKNGVVTRYGADFARYKGPAIKAAQHKCGRKCKKLAWVCTTRHF